MGPVQRALCEMYACSLSWVYETINEGHESIEFDSFEILYGQPSFGLCIHLWALGLTLWFGLSGHSRCIGG